MEETGHHCPAEGIASLQLPDLSRRRQRLLGLLAFCLLLIAPACAFRRVERPDVLLVTIDTLRADRVGVYGDSLAETPVLDALAHNGVRFTGTSAVAPITLPAHASILTGRYPASHGVRNNGTFSLSESERTIAEILSEEGYGTGAFVGAVVLHYRHGLNQGFETYDDWLGLPDTPGGPPQAERRAAAVTDAALEWMRSQPQDRPLFTWVHYFDPHTNYEPPEPFLSRFDDRYRGEIAYTDQELGRLLEGLADLGRRERTLVTVVSDHGEAFGEHGEFQHGLFIYEPTIHIPWIIDSPGESPKDLVVPTETSQVDLAPTILGFLGLEIPDTLQGQDFSTLLRGEGPPPPRQGVVIETWLPRLEFGWSELYGWRAGGWKFIDAPRPELFHLEEDPDETRNLYSGESERSGSYEAHLQESLAALEAQASDQRVAGVDEEVARQLRSLGYLTLGKPGSGPPSEEDSEALADPKDRLRHYLLAQRVNALTLVGRWREAADAAEEYLTLDPGNPFVQRQRAESLLFSGQVHQAEELYRQYLKEDPDNCWAMRRLGAIEIMERQNSEKGEALYLSSLECDPNQPDLWQLLASLSAEREDVELTIQRLEKALELAPSNTVYWFQLGKMREKQGDPEGAREALRQALELDPRNGRAARALQALR